MKKIYIAGCGGMLGEAFYRQFKNDYELQCTDKDINEPWLSLQDFRFSSAYQKKVIDFAPDYLFHLGAWTDLEYCENNKFESVINNTWPVIDAVNIANKLNIPLLYISTAGIFNGKKDFYDETDTPDPLGAYALTKYWGERHVLRNANKYFVCRAGWMMGGGPEKDKKFIGKLMRQIKAGAKELFIVNDKDGTPTYTHDFARNVKKLIEGPYYGLWNMVCGGQTSRIEVAAELLSILNLTDKIKIIPVTSDYFKKEYFAPRPACERLVNKRLDEMGLNIMRPWKVALREYILTYWKGYL
jgi:dTDP-4-dehydrorhamnose reductase